jgi:hypothetical protein
MNRWSDKTMKLSKMNAAWLLCAVMALIVGVPAKAQSAPPDIIVTAQDNGKDITLHGSQRLIVRFSFPGGTGYGWSALMTPDSVLAFTKAPAPKEKKQAGQQDMRWSAARITRNLRSGRRILPRAPVSGSR